MTDIRKGENRNVVVKLDMAKAYDRVDQRFFMKVLIKIDFSNKF